MKLAFHTGVLVRIPNAPLVIQLPPNNPGKWLPASLSTGALAITWETHKPLWVPLQLQVTAKVALYLSKCSLSALCISKDDFFLKNNLKKKIEVKHRMWLLSHLLLNFSSNTSKFHDVGTICSHPTSCPLLKWNCETAVIHMNVLEYLVFNKCLMTGVSRIYQYTTGFCIHGFYIHEFNQV